LFEYAFLRGRGMERQNLLYGFAHAIVQVKDDAGPLPQATALEFHPDLQKEKLFENQPAMRRRALFRQLDEGRAGLRKMDSLKGGATIHQLQTPAEDLRNAVGNLFAQIAKRAVDDPAKPTRIQLASGRGFINGNNAANFE